MGYPMTYKRVVGRNGLGGDYIIPYPDEQPKQALGLVAGDLRRFEKDQRDDKHLAAYARRTGLTEAQVLHVLDLLFEGDF